MDEQRYWEAVLARDAAYDGCFVFAVRTTGIYCRPSCPARRPKREHVRFFADAAAAERAGFRACRRCGAPTAEQRDPMIDLVERVCRFLEEPHERLPTLEELAARFAVSPYHLQRSFSRIVGVSPRRYADSHRQDRLRAQLRAGADVSGALYDAGYASSSAVYGQAGALLGMTPAHYRAGGRAANIRYTVTPCPLGHILVAATDRGICKVSLGDSPATLLEDLSNEFDGATIRHDGESLGAWVAALLDYLAGVQPHLDLPLDVQATAFQRQVWEALRAIPYGTTQTYQQVAQRIGRPTALRAVAQACAGNPAALIIPCHRVVRASGELGGYRWGVARKQALLEREACEV